MERDTHFFPWRTRDSREALLAWFALRENTVLMSGW